MSGDQQWPGGVPGTLGSFLKNHCPSFISAANCIFLTHTPREKTVKTSCPSILVSFQQVVLTIIGGSGSGWCINKAASLLHQRLPENSPSAMQCNAIRRSMILD